MDERGASTNLIIGLLGFLLIIIGFWLYFTVVF
jgi:hypothetical protein